MEATSLRGLLVYSELRVGRGFPQVSRKLHSSHLPHHTRLPVSRQHRYPTWSGNHLGDGDGDTSPPTPSAWRWAPLSSLRSGEGPGERGEVHGVYLRLTFPGANPRPRLEPFHRLDTVVSYFIGNDPDQWRLNVPVWGGVRYADLYPGIDLELTGQNGRLVPRLVARPGADLGAVRLRGGWRGLGVRACA